MTGVKLTIEWKAEGQRWWWTCWTCRDRIHLAEMSAEREFTHEEKEKIGQAQPLNNRYYLALLPLYKDLKRHFRRYHKRAIVGGKA